MFQLTRIHIFSLSSQSNNQWVEQVSIMQSLSVLIANAHLQQSHATVHQAMERRCCISVQSPGPEWHGSIGISDTVLPTRQCYHRLSPASAFASCVMVRNEIPSFSSVAKTTVPWPSTPFSISCPSSVVLSNWRPSSARCGSTSTLGIVVVANFYTSTVNNIMEKPSFCHKLHQILSVPIIKILSLAWSPGNLQ